MGFAGFDFTDVRRGLGRVHPPDRGPAVRHGRHDLRAARGRSGTCSGPARRVDHPGTKRRYLDGVFPTPDGRRRFLPRDHQDPRELPDHEFPLVLTTGRLYAHWHTLTRTGQVAQAGAPRAGGRSSRSIPTTRASSTSPTASIAEVASRRGMIRLPVRLNPGCAAGMVFVPFHWGDLYGDATPPTT